VTGRGNTRRHSLREILNVKLLLQRKRLASVSEGKELTTLGIEKLLDSKGIAYRKRRPGGRVPNDEREVT
jgi:hypothetical protein